MKILFEGDSITDAARILEWTDDLGVGYAMMAASLYRAQTKDNTAEFKNTAVSGSRIIELKQRWDKVLEYSPDVLSVYIGVNDCWRRYDQNDPISAADFENGYREILSAVKAHCDPRLIIVEPYVLPVMEGQDKWREDLDPKIQAVRKIAREFNAVLVPLDGIFAAHASYNEPSFWSWDGVHPTSAGHAVIANAWLDAFYSLF